MDKRVKHGHSRDNGQRTITYNSWANIIRRCTTQTNSRWQHYGGRGIVVCERWKDFRNFLADMGERPSKNHSIDRINNDGNYEPENCRWATPAQQHANQRHCGGGKPGQGAGEANSQARLTEKQVRNIRARYPLRRGKTGPRTPEHRAIIAAICKDHSISEGLARRIAYGYRWRDIV